MLPTRVHGTRGSPETYRIRPRQSGNLPDTPAAVRKPTGYARAVRKPTGYARGGPGKPTGYARGSPETYRIRPRQSGNLPDTPAAVRKPTGYARGSPKTYRITPALGLCIRCHEYSVRSFQPTFFGSLHSILLCKINEQYRCRFLLRGSVVLH